MADPQKCITVVAALTDENNLYLSSIYLIPVGRLGEGILFCDHFPDLMLNKASTTAQVTDIHLSCLTV